MFIEQIIDWADVKIESWLGSRVVKAKHTAEFSIPEGLLNKENVVGYCMTVPAARSFVESALEFPPLITRREKKKLSQITKSINKEKTRFIIVVSESPARWVTSLRTRCAVKRALKNHERMHALTMMKDNTWHVLADEIMWANAPEAWDNICKKIIEKRIYASRIEACDYDPELTAWILVTEILGRVAAMLHSPPDLRSEIARHQLSGGEEELEQISSWIEHHWSNVETLIGWLDSHRWK